MLILDGISLILVLCFVLHTLIDLLLTSTLVTVDDRSERLL